MKMELMDRASPGSVYACHKTGWMQLESFKNFIGASYPSEQKPAVLIFDGHVLHAKNYEMVDLAKTSCDSSIPNTSLYTRLQFLNVSFMKPRTTYYIRAANLITIPRMSRVCHRISTSVIVTRTL